MKNWINLTVITLIVVISCVNPVVVLGFNTEGGKTIKVIFYRWDRNTGEKGDFLGTAEFNNGELNYNVTDSRLEKLLGGNFYTMVSEKQNGNIVEKNVIYKKGTLEHLDNVIKHCKDISCIAEIADK